MEQSPAVVKLENEVKHLKDLVKTLDARAGPNIVDDADTSEQSEIDSNIEQIEHEVEQIDEQFSGNHVFTTNVSHGK